MAQFSIRTRRQRPYWCQHIRLESGKPDCLVTLEDSDTNLCKKHEAEKQEAEKRFFEKPIFSEEKPQDDAPIERIWP